ncbi:MAG TPA: hypothetical protein VKA30_10100 [Actinomycetota bacterium]|nr:hypothetical protein [Actinomycetota bacterium]
MKFKTGLIVGFGAGYVLGARAGRERYEQLRRRWEEFTGSPTVQKAAERTMEAAEEGGKRTLHAVQQGVEKAGSAVKERLSKDGSEEIAESWPGKEPEKAAEAPAPPPPAKAGGETPGT